MFEKVWKNSLNNGINRLEIEMMKVSCLAGFPRVSKAGLITMVLLFVGNGLQWIIRHLFHVISEQRRNYRFLTERKYVRVGRVREYISWRSIS